MKRSSSDSTTSINKPLPTSSRPPKDYKTSYNHNLSKKIPQPPYTQTYSNKKSQVSSQVFNKDTPRKTLQQHNRTNLNLPDCDNFEAINRSIQKSNSKEKIAPLNDIKYGSIENDQFEKIKFNLPNNSVLLEKNIPKTTPIYFHADKIILDGRKKYDELIATHNDTNHSRNHSLHQEKKEISNSVTIRQSLSENKINFGSIRRQGRNSKGISNSSISVNRSLNSEPSYVKIMEQKLKFEEKSKDKISKPMTNINRRSPSPLNKTPFGTFTELIKAQKENIIKNKIENMLTKLDQKAEINNSLNNNNTNNNLPNTQRSSQVLRSGQKGPCVSPVDRQFFARKIIIKGSPSKATIITESSYPL